MLLAIPIEALAHNVLLLYIVQSGDLVCVRLFLHEMKLQLMEFL